MHKFQDRIHIFFFFHSIHISGTSVLNNYAQGKKERQKWKSYCPETLPRRKLFQYEMDFAAQETCSFPIQNYIRSRFLPLKARIEVTNLWWAER